MSSDRNDYEVGYGKPPKHTRFVKGRSGNPRGRPKQKQSDSASAEIHQVFDSVCGTAVVDGRKKPVTGEEYMLRSLAIKALKGSVKATELLLWRKVEIQRLLAPHCGTKNGAHKNGGMIIMPEILPIDEWETAAIAQQQRLRRSSLEDSQERDR